MSQETSNFSKDMNDLATKINPEYNLYSTEESVIGDKPRTIESIYESERLSWTSIIKKMAQGMSNLTSLSDVQIDLYSQRAVVTDRIYSLTPTYHSLTKSFKKKKLDSSEKFKRGETGPTRLGHLDKSAWMDVQLSQLSYQINLIKAHIEFLRETISTIDNMIFGIKHRIDLENWKNTYK